ncbi:hypothetical protein D3C71_2080270 [compost metagenome]
MSVLVPAVLVICTCGSGVLLAVAVHGGAVLPGAQVPPPEGVALAVLAMVAGGVLLTVAVTV